MNPIQDYFKPTPRLARKIGDVILLMGTTFTVWGGITGRAHWLIITGAVITLLGKMVTNFFSEDAV